MRVSFLGKLSLMAASAFICASVSAADITGAGATFPYPIYAKWAEAYKAKTGTRLNYQAIGSGGGIKQIKAKTVDFGASDMPLKADDLKAAGLVQFPAILGGWCRSSIWMASRLASSRCQAMCWRTFIWEKSRSGTMRKFRR